MNKKTGITLIALIITIIVMLILVAVIITMAVNGRLFGYAGNATKDTELAKQEELQLADGIIGGKSIEELVMGGKGLPAGAQIPAGGVYLRISDMTSYYSQITNNEETIINGQLSQIGQTFNSFEYRGETAPNGLMNNDLYLFGDYIYVLFDSEPYPITGWNAITYDQTKTSYGEILSSINGGVVCYLINTFSNCASLTTSPTIPDSVVYMGGTFDRCTSLDTAPIIPDSVMYMEGTFYGCTSLVEVPNFPKYVTDISGAFSDCTLLETVPNFPASITTIGNGTFSRCNSLRSITIPETVTVIDSYAFSGCETIERITIPESITYIGEGAFDGCRNITEIIIPNSVTYMGKNMFSGCSKLESITISNSVTTIKDHTFNLCDKLTSVTIPKSVTKIESFAFNCSNLRSINYQGKISEWNTIDLATNWKAYSPITTIHCTDGDITL